MLALEVEGPLAVVNTPLITGNWNKALKQLSRGKDNYPEGAGHDGGHIRECGEPDHPPKRHTRTCRRPPAQLKEGCPQTVRGQTDKHTHAKMPSNYRTSQACFTRPAGKNLRELNYMCAPSLLLMRMSKRYPNTACMPVMFTL